MGFGDDVITTGIVKRAFAKVGKPLAVGDGTAIRWSEVFDGNPKIAREVYPGCLWVNQVKGNRPYLDYTATNQKVKQTYNYSYRVEPGEIFLSDSEKGKYAHLSGFVYIEPNVKGSYAGNKDWGFDNWQRVVDAIPDVRFMQGIGKRLRRVDQFETDSFRDAARMLSHAALFVGTDGGLHHAAAALGIRGVVVWGGLAPPEVLGYATHINLSAGGKACGMQSKCEHCRKAMAAIKPEMVIESIRNALDTDARQTGALQNCV